MYTFVTILIMIVCVLLGAVVLIQNPKGGGLNATMGGVGQQLLGARRSTDVVEKLTWGFAIAFMVFCLSTAFLVDKNALRKDVIAEPDITKTMTSAPSSFQAPSTTPQQTQPAQQAPAQPTP